MRPARAEQWPALLAFWLAAAPAALGGGESTRPKDPATSTCVSCHEEIAEELGPQAEEWKGSIHAAAGITCHDCHGGDPSAEDMLEAKRAETGYVGVPKTRAEVAPRCARCHGDIEYMRQYNPSMRVDQLVEYLTSRHGKAVHQQGSDRAATCTDCHGKHAILRVSDPRSSVFPAQVAQTCARCHADAARVGEAGLPIDVHDRWAAGVHGRALSAGDLSAPTCNDCHGNHGAVPPGVRSVVHVCGRCHATQEEHFQAGTHRAHFERLEKAPCVTCHGNHEVRPASDALLASREPGVCGKCHETGGSCDQAAARMLGDIQRLATETAETEALLSRAEQLGMDVSDARFRLSEVRDRLTMARVVVHRFREADFGEVVGEGDRLLLRIRADGDQALEEWQFRRKGLALSLVLIALVVVLLVIKVRRIERARRGSEDGAALEPSIRHLEVRR
jgi:predicted CXXCH cytochrome family protein